MEKLEVLKEKINHIEEDLISVKKTMIELDSKNKQKTEAIWQDLMSASKDISKQWKGLSVVEEIKRQREKN